MCEELKCPFCKEDIVYVKAWSDEHVCEYRCKNCNRIFIVSGNVIL